MKRNILIAACFLILIFTLGCNKTENLNGKELNTGKPKLEELSTGTSNKLTLDIVKKLSKDGDNLSWEDFKAYDGKDIGFGLYIKMYPIDDKYSIQIGGTSLKEKPMYISLVDNTIKDNAKCIDIRHDDIEKFINNAS